ncbi:MAG TPA: bifunctional serine/threonine-protein kinase/formylglycine-generating enzyme family protein [Candidatus Brocadiia bacterium]|nr:bifunctional serine/threonine-protein kinase/formylglycine-generating enzyme family protein [Candidatus Brocadiia bacterium]
MPEYVSPDDEISAQLLLKRGYVTESQINDCIKAQEMLWGQGDEGDLLQVIQDKGFLTSIQAEEIRRAMATRGKAKLLAGFEILDLIGRGAMGKVYKARQISLDRIVALKILPTRLAKDKEYVARFLQEAKSAARLNHPNVVHCYEVGQARGYYFMAMELVQGENIRNKLKREGKLPEKEALGIALQVARALEHAAENNIVHRDIKPDNILYIPAEEKPQLGGICGLAKLSDLGLAKQIGDDPGLTQSGATVGTPLYISPEQAAGEADVDIRADIYSLGATLFHMLTGSPPYTGTSSGAVLAQHLNASVPNPRDRNPAINWKSSEICVKAMAKTRDKRYQRPTEMAEAIESALKITSTQPQQGFTQAGVEDTMMATPVSAAVESEVEEEVVVVSEGISEEEEAENNLELQSSNRLMTVGDSSSQRADVSQRSGSRPAVGASFPKPGRGLGIPWGKVFGALGVAAFLAIAGAVVMTIMGGEDSPPIVEQPAMIEPAPTEPIDPNAGKPVKKPTDEIELLSGQPAHMDAAAASSFQSEQAGNLALEAEINIPLGIKLRLIPPGAFAMGGAFQNVGVEERPRHLVKISRPFYIAETEVTQAQYEALMGKNPSEFKGQANPVENVTWEEAQEFCRLLSQKEGGMFRLPTEAEWEYASRAGSIQEFYYGSNAFKLSDYAWYEKNALNRTRPVGEKTPNGWGLADVYGNVWEWCSDWYDAAYYRSSPEADPAGPASGSKKSARGGSWNNKAPQCRSAARMSYDPGTRSNRLGFRVARDAGQ